MTDDAMREFLAGLPPVDRTPEQQAAAERVRAAAPVPRPSKRDVFPGAAWVVCPHCDCCALGPEYASDPEDVCASCGLSAGGSDECEPCGSRNRARVAATIPADVHFEDDEGRVLARVPTDRADLRAGVIVTIGRSTSRARGRVELVEDGWLHVRLL